MAPTAGDFYPEGLRAEIDDLNARIYHTVNNVSLRAAAGLVGDGGGDRLDGGADNDQLYGYDGDDVSAGYLATCCDGSIHGIFSA